DVNQGRFDSSPREFTLFTSSTGEESLFFSARNHQDGREVFRITSDGTIQEIDIGPGANGANPTGFTEFNGSIYFQANDSSGIGTELWRVNVDANDNATAQLVANISPGNGSSNPDNFYVFDNALYFSASGGTGIGDELYRVIVDGGNNTTVQLVDN